MSFFDNQLCPWQHQQSRWAKKKFVNLYIKKQTSIPQATLDRKTVLTKKKLVFYRLKDGQNKKVWMKEALGCENSHVLMFNETASKCFRSLDGSQVSTNNITSLQLRSVIENFGYTQDQPASTIS